jgi:hypothetical protein
MLASKGSGRYLKLEKPRQLGKNQIGEIQKPVVQKNQTSKCDWAMVNHVRIIEADCLRS